MVAHVGWRACARARVCVWASRLRCHAEVLRGLRVVRFGHLARHVRRALGHRALHVDDAVARRALLGAVGQLGAAHLVHSVLDVLGHAPLLLGVGHLARLLRVEAQLDQRAAHVRHVLAAAGGELGKLRKAKEVVGEQTLRLVETSDDSDWVRVRIRFECRHCAHRNPRIFALGRARRCPRRPCTAGKQGCRLCASCGWVWV